MYTIFSYVLRFTALAGPEPTGGTFMSLTKIEACAFTAVQNATIQNKFGSPRPKQYLDLGGTMIYLATTYIVSAVGHFV